jgi:hypothetical protein
VIGPQGGKATVFTTARPGRLGQVAKRTALEKYACSFDLLLRQFRPARMADGQGLRGNLAGTRFPLLCRYKRGAARKKSHHDNQSCKQVYPSYNPGIGKVSKLACTSATSPDASFDAVCGDGHFHTFRAANAVGVLP